LLAQIEVGIEKYCNLFESVSLPVSEMGNRASFTGTS
jgi:hypothetical protein